MAHMAPNNGGSGAGRSRNSKTTHKETKKDSITCTKPKHIPPPARHRFWPTHCHRLCSRGQNGFGFETNAELRGVRDMVTRWRGAWPGSKARRRPSPLFFAAPHRRQRQRAIAEDDAGRQNLQRRHTRAESGGFAGPRDEGDSPNWDQSARRHLARERSDAGRRRGVRTGHTRRHADIG